MSIKPLSQHTAKRLTTAQVITSVFSVVKELVENSIDAGANDIAVTLDDQGTSFIEVRDNGGGIAKADSEFIAQPAYTSKISDFADLNTLETYGFRGEALNALCRVADVKVTTKTLQDDAARCYTMHQDGTIQKAEYCARSIGTTVQVQTLFKNIPMRRQIIKEKKNVKQSIKAIESLLQDFGVCHPRIRIAYTVDDKNVFVLQPTTTLKDSITSIFGRKITLNYEFLNFTNSEMHIDLTVPKKDINSTNFPTICQTTSYSHVYVNRRPVTYPEFENLVSKLLCAQFSEKITGKKKPIFFLIINVPPLDIDVNLEPNKTKVLLKNRSQTIEIVKKMIVEYYGITEPEDLFSQVANSMDDLSVQSNASVREESTDSFSEIEPESPLANKKRPISRRKSMVAKKLRSDDDGDKENEVNSDNNVAHDVPATEEETLSQMPKVDLGEDFNTQEIRSKSTLEQDQVDVIMKEMEEAKTVNTSIFATPEKPKQGFTASQWSRGHCPGVQGGIDVVIVGPSAGSTTPKKKQTNTTPSSSGFLKFSEQIRRQIIHMNPELNFVQVANLVSEKWKQLSAEERNEYRELAREAKSPFNSKLNTSSGCQKRKAQISPQQLENNKKKMLNMVENMKVRKPNGNNSSDRLKTCIPWEINMDSVIINCQKPRQSLQNSNHIIGILNDKLCFVKINSQIWMMDTNKLFDDFAIEDESERDECKRKPELAQSHFKRWLIEKDPTNAGGLYPIHELQ